MKNTRSFTLRGVLAMGIAATLAACASAPKNNAALDEARAAYDRAAADEQVARSAPVELRKAQQALKGAEAAMSAGEDLGAVEHYAYLARQRTELALQADRIAKAEQAIAEASMNRDRILIEARTREAEAQRVVAEKARLEADAQKGQAEAARRLAESRMSQADAARKLAEERLAAAQASQAQTELERARARALEKELEQLQAKQTERGMVLTLGDVLFDVGKADLHPGAARTIDQLAQFLKENAERTIEIEGYTDSSGSESLNQVLSERRANAVKSALAERGIAVDRIAARGFGPANPVANNNTATGRQLNRRVEVVVSRKS